MNVNQQSEQAVSEFGSSPPTQNKSHLVGEELSRDFALLKELNVNQLRELIESPELMDSFVECSLSVQVLRGHTERLIETTEKLATDNLSLEPELTKLQSEVTERCRELCDLRIKYDNSNVEYQKLCEKYNPMCIKESLLQSVATIDEDSEKVAEAFLNGETDLESFVQDYISHRAMSHSHKIRYEKLSKQLEKLKQAGY